MLEKSAAIPPLRYYQQILGSKGLVAYAIATWPPNGPVLNDLMAQGAVITEAEVERKSHELRLGLAGDDLREIVNDLNLMRATVHAAEALPPELEHYEEMSKEIESCLNELLRKLPKFIEAHHKFDTKRAFISAARLTTLLQATKDYLDDRWSAFGGRPPYRRREPWHGDAVYLMGLYNKARGRSELLSYVKAESPIVKFIAWAFDRIGAKHRERRAIAQVLNRRRRQSELKV